MRIIHLAAGAGDMYCGACARDAALIGGLVRRGHDVQAVQLYTPVRPTEDDVFAGSPIYMGGIAVYLDQVLPSIGPLPSWLTRPLDSPALLRLAGKFALRTQAKTLGPMTISMLQGMAGRQRPEIRKLTRYLESLPPADIIVITNSLLSGLAPAIKDRLGVPIVCGLMGEDSFVACLPEKFQTGARDLMSENARSVDMFLAPGQDYADKMAAFLAVPRDRVVIAPAGVRVPPKESSERADAGPNTPFVVGYLSSITSPKGLDLLIDAVRLLSDSGRDLALHVAGKPLDAVYWRGVRSRAALLGERFRYYGEVDFAGKEAFLRGCDVFCAPSRIAESRGMAVMEAMAVGLPAIVPSRGTFPELIEATRGGLMFASEDVRALADAIAQLMDRPDEAARFGASAKAGIARLYSVDVMVDATLAAYERVTSRQSTPA